MIRFRRRHDTGRTFPIIRRLPVKIPDVYHEKYFSSSKEEADRKVNDALNIALVIGQSAGDEHAMMMGRSEWNRSDLNVANEATQNEFYKHIPEAAVYGVGFRHRIAGPYGSFAETARILKKLHRYKGYIPPEETRSEMIRRLGLRNVPGAKEAYTEKKD